MILQSLVKYYDALVAKNEIESLGWASVKVSWGLEIDENGNVLDVLPLNNKNEIMPFRLRKSSEIRSCFLCDDRRYILGIPNSNNSKDIDYSEKAFNDSVNLYSEIIGECDSAFSKAIIKFFESWSKQKNSCIDKIKDIKKGENITFFFSGEWCCKNADIINAWNDYFEKKESEDKRECRCMITGNLDSICRIHPNLPLPGGTNPKLISFDKESTAFYSYGTDGKQAECIPIGVTTAMKYSSSLSWLLLSKDNSINFADGKIVFWAEGALHEEEKMFNFSINPDKEFITENDLKLTLTKIVNGESLNFSEAMKKPDNKFYVAFLSAAKGRIIVRSLNVNAFIELIKNIKKHYDDIDIVTDNRSKFKTIPLKALLNETVINNKSNNNVFEKQKEKTPLPQLSTDVLKAIITGGRYPETLINQVFIRIRAEKNITRGKAAIIKAYLIRNTKSHKDYKKITEVTTMALNEESNYTPYVLGRLFSVLEEIQERANPGINATIKDRFFNSACATPSSIFPMLMKLSNNHLKKLDIGARISLDKKCQN